MVMAESHSNEVTAGEMVPKTSGGGLTGLYEVITDPAGLFTRMKETPRVLAPYVALVVVLLFSFYMMSDFIVRIQLDLLRERGAPPGVGPTPEQMKYSFIIMGTLTMALVPLLTSLLTLFWGNFVMGGKARFKQLLSVSVYSEYLFALGVLVMVPLVLYKGTILISLSAAMLLDNPNPQGVLYVALSKISVFHIWEFIALGIGFSTIYGFSRNKGYVLAVLSMGLLILLHVLMTAVGQMFV
jgi:hypothetical protein